PETTPVYVAAHALMQQIVGFPIHCGVLALGERGAPEDLDTLLGSTPARSVVLGLSGVVNHDNVGAMFRNAAAFGVDAVVLDGETCDPLYRKALRVSVGGSLVVPFARAATEAALVDALRRAGYTVLALSPPGGGGGPRGGRVRAAVGSGRTARRRRSRCRRAWRCSSVPRVPGSRPRRSPPVARCAFPFASAGTRSMSAPPAASRSSGSG